MAPRPDLRTQYAAVRNLGPARTADRKRRALRHIKRLVLCGGSSSPICSVGSLTKVGLSLEHRFLRLCFGFELALGVEILGDGKGDMNGRRKCESWNPCRPPLRR